MHRATGHDGRYAPSPTGDLHLGNLRTALAAWLFARHAGARLILRLDDLDPDRVRPGSAQRQIDDLTALGIDWNGAPVRQTHRLDAYAAALAQLEARNQTYPCFCTRADIRAAATAPHGDGPELPYPGTCAQLAPDATAARIAAGDAYAVRVRANGAVVHIDDRIAGRVEIVVDDFVVRRKDNVPAYLLATTVDDHDLGVGEVVRGADLVTSAPRQQWLAEQLGLHVPTFAHIPLVLGTDGARLAKRHGTVTLRDLVEHGIGPDAVRRWLGASLGLVGDDDRTVTISQLLERFDPDQLPTTPITVTAEFQAL